MSRSRKRKYNQVKRDVISMLDSLKLSFRYLYEHIITMTEHLHNFRTCNIMASAKGFSLSSNQQRLELFREFSDLQCTYSASTTDSDPHSYWLQRSQIAFILLQPSVDNSYPLCCYFIIILSSHANICMNNKKAQFKTYKMNYFWNFDY